MEVEEQQKKKQKKKTKKNKRKNKQTNKQKSIETPIMCTRLLSTLAFCTLYSDLYRLGRG